VAVACATPPGPTCLPGNVAHSYDVSGVCAAGACSYSPTDTACSTSCSGGVCTQIATAISAGYQHTCAVVAGGAKCWGRGHEGQLGNGGVFSSLVPLDLSGQAILASTVSTGWLSTCAIGTTGALSCWGSNGNGQLGNSIPYSCDVPVGVNGLGTGVKAVGISLSYACAITAAGAVKCWGDNLDGELGNNSTTPSWYPVDVVGLGSGAVALTVGDFHACAVTAAGTVKCWGANTGGELGSGTNVRTLVPIDVVGLGPGVIAVASGQSTTCALTSAGALACWGGNSTGLLGNGSTIPSKVPVGVVGLGSGVAAVSVGDGHACAVTAAGAMKCWGSNAKGQLGDGSVIGSLVPIDVAGLGSGVASISAGHGDTCAVTSVGGVKCWGANDSGQLGNGSTIGSPTPIDVASLGSGIVSVSTAESHACAVRSSGIVTCWGDNFWGELGLVRPASSATPVDVLGLSPGVASLSAGNTHTCAVTSAGAAGCWGSNSDAQLGSYAVPGSSVPLGVLGLGSGILSVGSGWEHTCAVTVGGAVECWGKNQDGSLGNGTTNPSVLPVAAVGLGSGVTAVSSGDGVTCALTSAGAVECWGNNAVGNGVVGPSYVPVGVVGLGSGVVAISTGDYFACALTTAGAVKCWGYGALGGNGNGAPSTTPLDVVGLGSGVVSISSGWQHACALTAAGAVKCWGKNLQGGLGDGTTLDSAAPVDVAGLGSGVIAVSAGGGHTCALTVTGAVECWGANSYGQLGNGSTTASLVPVEVTGL
jgi:alpha-tubulin suppressor-like RCC1 family protein